jgi:hypothetical protein
MDEFQELKSNRSRAYSLSMNEESIRIAENTLESSTSTEVAPNGRLAGWQRQSDRVGSRAVGAQATGALAVGALAIGALAIGRLAIRRLEVGRSRVERLEIGELDVRRLQVEELVVTGRCVTPDGSPKTE